MKTNKKYIVYPKITEYVNTEVSTIELELREKNSNSCILVTFKLEDLGKIFMSSMYKGQQYSQNPITAEVTVGEHFGEHLEKVEVSAIFDKDIVYEERENVLRKWMDENGYKDWDSNFYLGRKNSKVIKPDGGYIYNFSIFKYENK